MDVLGVKGINKLFQAVSEALEIEKCSICLERLENTVLLWPCTHWYCNKCILSLYKSAKGEKVTCPLCKCATTRRKVLHFQDKQTEYEDYLQTLIGALSLDLKFDVTSYNNARNNQNSFENIAETSKEDVRSSPVKRTKEKGLVRVIEVKKKPEVRQNKKKPSGKCNPANINSTAVKNGKGQYFKSPKTTPVLLPETPDSPKQKKVKEWLDANKFSQAEQDVCIETVIADVHNAEHDESYLSEVALLSVSQAGHGVIQTPIKPMPSKKSNDMPTDIDAIKVCNNSSENLFSKGKIGKNLKPISLPAVEKFDQIFPENRKLQAVTTTYGSKNPYVSTRTRGQRFAVQVDLFKSIDEGKGDSEKSSPGESSEETLEDFSSGSGEEWTIEKRPRKCNLLAKPITLKNKIKQNAQENKKNSMVKYENAKPIRRCLRNSNKPVNSKSKIKTTCDFIKDKNASTVKNVAVEEFIKPKDDIVKEIIDDWNDTKDSNNIFSVKSQISVKQDENITKHTETKTGNLSRPNSPFNIKNKVVKTPSKEGNIRSPGWSRLKSTKKEFHLSEKKRLSLKTLNTSKSNSSFTNLGISPLLNHSKVSGSSNTNPEQTIAQSDNSISVDEIINLPKNDTTEKVKKLHTDVPHDEKNKKTPELNKSLNISLTSTASGSPFRGFPSQKENECSKKCASHIGQITEVSQNPCNILGFSQNKSGKSKTIPDEDSKEHLSNNYSREEPMEVDILPFQDSKSLFQCENDKSENRVNGILTDKETSVSKAILESKSVITTLQEEPNSTVTKKRDRDSGIHNESGISSPVRKRMCRDAEVQTSPGRMKSAIRDMLKDLCGIELDEMINKSVKADSMKSIDKVVVTSPSHTYKGASQDSDKENVNIDLNGQNIPKKCLDESDIVFGTEDITDLAQTDYHVARGNNYFDSNDVDPDAPTQRYKTPVIPKKPLQTSTKEYTVVSNPTLSELKKTESLFDKSDIIFPDETPKGATPWNYSGVDQLEGNTNSVKKTTGENAILYSSQSLKEKANKSRRQLDFVEDDSNDLFEFERQISGKLNEEVLNDKSNNCVTTDHVGTLPDRIDELDDIFMQSNELQDSILNCGEDSVSHKNVSTVEQIEMNVEHQIVSENLSDTPGIVGPSEVQTGDRSIINLRSSNKASDCRPSYQNKIPDSNPIVTDKAVLCMQKSNDEIGESVNKHTHYQQSTNELVKDQLDAHIGDTPMFKDTSTVQKETSSNNINAIDDEESNAASDVSFVEGTPDVSHNEENDKEIFDNESYTKKTCGQSVTAVDISDDVHDKREKEISEMYLHDPVQENESINRKEQLHQMIQDKPIDPDESVSNQMIQNTEAEEESLCFASSLLNPQQNQVLACVLGGMGITYSKSVGPHISHLIVGTKNGCFQNTYKVLLAMALHKPIIRFDWVEEVIRTGGTVSLDPFVALDPSGECGVVRAKADKERKLLHNFAVHIYNVNDRIVLKEQIEELVRLCGGTVVNEMQDFQNVSRDKFRIIVLSEPPDSLTQGDWRQKYSAVEVMIDWVYNTVGRYRVMPLVPFMVTEASDAVPFLQHHGYPKEFIFDLSTQE